MARTAGLSTTTPALLSERRRLREHRDLVEAAAPVTPAGDDSAGILVRLDDIADHPENTRDEIGDVSDIAATLPTLGLLQMPIVSTAAAFLAVYPQYAEHVGSRGYVALIGHRRFAACRQVGWSDVKVRVNNDLIDVSGLDIETMFAENVHRQNLNPIEEAKAFYALTQRGRTQRDIESRLGVPQAQISKRLKLLELTPELQVLVVGGRVPVYDGGPLPLTEAALYAKLGADAQRDSWAIAEKQGLRAAAAIAAYKLGRDREAGLEVARKRAAKEGIEVVDADAVWGEQAPAHYLRDQADIDTAREAGSLSASVDSRGDFVYVATAVTVPKQRDEDDSERRAASLARAAVCRRIASRKPAASDAVRRLSAAVVDRSTTYAEALKLAYTWMTSSNVGPDTTDAYAYREAILAAGDDPLLTHLAFIMALGYDELRAREADRDWDRRDVQHVDRLIADAGYVPTAWELRRLDQARQNIPAESRLRGGKR